MYLILCTKIYHTITLLWPVLHVHWPFLAVLTHCYFLIAAVICFIFLEVPRLFRVFNTTISCFCCYFLNSNCNLLYFLGGQRDYFLFLPEWWRLLTLPFCALCFQSFVTSFSVYFTLSPFFCKSLTTSTSLLPPFHTFSFVGYPLSPSFSFVLILYSLYCFEMSNIILLLIDTQLLVESTESSF